MLYFCLVNTCLTVCRVPEDKCHMVLPEIEEEDMNGQRLSLTSLLLGTMMIIPYS